MKNQGKDPAYRFIKHLSAPFGLSKWCTICGHSDIRPRPPHAQSTYWKGGGENPA